jgi:hypothetical protein
LPLFLARSPFCMFLGDQRFDPFRQQCMWIVDCGVSARFSKIEKLLVFQGFTGWPLFR